MEQFELFDSFVKSNKSDDIVVRDFVALKSNAKLVFIESLVNKQLIDSCVLAPLQKSNQKLKQVSDVVKDVLCECSATTKTNTNDIKTILHISE